jgi:hypothetical protein
LCWHLAASRGDVANLKGEDVDCKDNAVSFNPYAWKLTTWVFRAMLVAVPLFWGLGLLPSLMARFSERRTRRALKPR